MNVNNFLKELFEDTLGLDVLGLENRYKDLLELINRKTLSTFSNYIKCGYYHYLELSDKSIIVKEEYGRAGREYYINDPTLEKFNLPVLDVVKILYVGEGTSDADDGYYMNSLYQSADFSLESVLLGAERTNLITMTNMSLPYKRYHELRGDKNLFLKNYPLDGKVEVEIRTKFPNILAIPEIYKEVFMTLCKYDIKIKLWNELKYIEDVVTPNGNLNLKVSDWESAEKDREDFLRDFKGKSLPDRIGASFFTIV